jgi:bifunctional non-homologous end joining protein LigD
MTPAEELAAYLGARPSELDGTKIVPMLCEREEAGSKVLGRQGWLFELKLDGVRIIADKKDGKASLWYRKLREATESYAEIAEAVRSLAETRLVLDGEVVAFDDQGRPDFQRLGHRIQTGSGKRGVRSPVFVPVVYVVFDVLAIGPYDIRGFPLEARKAVLSRIVPDEGASNGLIRRHPTFENGVDLFRLCQEHRLEGVVAKKLGSSYRLGERSLDWLKIKAELDAEFVVIGWTEGENDRARLGALDLGAYEGDRLVFRGCVGSGLDTSTIDLLLERLLPIEVSGPVAEGKYKAKPKRRHCLPEVVVSVRYGGFSLDPNGARFLRFAVFRGVRPDVSPKDCTAGPDDGVDLVVPADAGTSSARPIARGRRIHVSAPAQVLLHDGTTKDALCTYFESVAPAILRHARGRVASLLRPDGAPLWPPPKWTPKFVRTTTSRAGSREVRGFVIDSVDVLLFAVEAGSPSIQHGPSIEGRPDVADFVAVRVSGPAAKRSDLVAAARSVRVLAAEIGLPAAVTAAGAFALDVLVGVGAAPALAAAPLGSLLAHLATTRDAPPGVKVEAIEVVTTPYTPCPARPLARPGEPVVVAVPLDWDELDEVDLASIDLTAAAARAAGGARSDALDPIKDPSIDVVAATKALERIVAARAPMR